jgi:hypothetical protein
VCVEGGIGIGAGVDGAIIIVVQGDCDPLGSGELLFQEMSNGHVLLSGEGGGTLTCTGLSQGFPCSSYGEDESLLLSLRDSRGYDIILLPLAVVVACCSSMEGLDVLLDMVGKTVEVRIGGGGRRRTLALSQR